MKIFILILIFLLIAFGILVYFRAEFAFNKYLENPITGTHHISVNPNAPVTAQNELLIDATPSRIWEVLSEINQWPSWQSEVTEAQIHGLLAVGMEFSWRAGGISFVSKIHTTESPVYLGWTGKTIGAYAIHNWTLEEQNGKTLVKVEESLEGILPAWLTGFFLKNLEKGMLKNLEELKEEAEKEPN